MRRDVFRLESRAYDRCLTPKLLTLVAAGLGLVSQPALAQGAAGMGGAAMAPQPRMAPMPQVPQAPAFIPSAPLPQPGSAMNGTPQGIPTTGSGAGPAKQKDTTTETVVVTGSRSPQQGLDKVTASPSPTGKTGSVAPGFDLSGTWAVADALPTGGDGSESIFDRWGNLFVEQGKVAPIPGAGVVLTNKSGGSVLQTTTASDGTFTLGQLTPGVHEIALSGGTVNDLTVRKAGGSPLEYLIALLLPAVQSAREASIAGGKASGPAMLVQHAFARSVSGRTDRKILVIIKQNSKNAICNII